jgi:hypothetical protein
MSEMRSQTESDDCCPICKAGLKGISPEKAVRPLGHKGRGNTIAVGQRNEYLCGAVKLTNKQYPDGTIEAKCCVPVALNGQRTP